MNRPWMPLHIADYLRDTSHLRAAESGAYLHLIMAYWVGGKLPTDDRQLATIAKLTDKEWRAMRPTLEAFFGEGFSSHKRIDKELAKVTEISNKRKAAVEQREIKRRSSDGSNDPSSDDTLNTSHLTKEEGKKKKEARATRGAPLPDDWRPSDEEKNYGLSLGLSSAQIETAAEEMRLWAAGNANRSIGRKADWSAAFKSWMRRNRKPERENVVQKSSNGNSGIIAAADKLVERLAGFGPKPGLLPVDGGGEGASVVRMLPQGRRERPGNLYGSNHSDPVGIRGGSGGACDGPEDGPATEVELPSDCG